MNANTLGAVGALVAFAGTILAMSSGTRLAGFVLLGTALTMGMVSLAHVRAEPSRQHHPHQPEPGRIPTLAVVLALFGFGLNSIPAVQADLAEIESHEYTDEQWREMQNRFGERHLRLRAKLTSESKRGDYDCYIHGPRAPISATHRTEAFAYRRLR